MLRRGAGSRSRTGTVSPPADFESATSTNSIIPADVDIIIQPGQKGKFFLKKVNYFFGICFSLPRWRFPVGALPAGTIPRPRKSSLADRFMGGLQFESSAKLKNGCIKRRGGATALLFSSSLRGSFPPFQGLSGVSFRSQSRPQGSGSKVIHAGRGNPSNLVKLFKAFLAFKDSLPPCSGLSGQVITILSRFQSRTRNTYPNVHTEVIYICPILVGNEIKRAIRIHILPPSQLKRPYIQSAL